MAAARMGGVQSLLGALEPLGWRSVIPGRRITGRRACGSVPRLVATLDDRSLVLVELEPGREFPPHGERRVLYLRCRAAVPDVTVLLVDAAWIRRIWLWESALHGGMLREAREPTGPDAAADMSALVLREMQVPAPRRSARGAGASMLSRIAARLPVSAAGGGRRRTGAPLRTSLLRYASGADSPRDSLLMWNALRSLKVVDAHCEEGDWLIDAVAALQPLYAATLQRMAGFHIDRQTAGVRVALPRGIRVALSGAGGSALPRLATYVHLTTLLHNVAGASPDRAALRIARLRLARALGTEDEEENRLIALVLRQRLVWIPPHRCREVAATGIAARQRDREAALLGSAFEVIRDLHLSRSAAPCALAAGYRSLERRIVALVAGSEDGAAVIDDHWARMCFPAHRGIVVTPEEP